MEARRTLPVSFASNTMTTKKCKDFAVSNGYTYYATQWGQQCYAGLNLALDTQSVPGVCNFTW